MSSKIIFDIEADGLFRESKTKVWDEELRKNFMVILPKLTRVWCIVAKDIESGTVYKFPPSKIKEGVAFLHQAETLIGHNIIGYDIPVLEKLYDFDFKGKIEDTLVMSRLFNPVRENGHSLGTWGYRVGCPKLEQPALFSEYTEEMLTYCVGDVNLNHKVYDALKQEQQGFSQQSLELEQDVARIMKEQEDNGFRLEEEYTNLLLNKLTTRKNEVEKEVQDTFKPIMVDDKLVTPKFKKDGTLSKSPALSEEEIIKCKENNYKPFMRQKLQEFNLGSRKQIGERVLELGWKPNRFTPTGQPIVDEPTLNKVKHVKEASLIAEFLLLQKRTSQLVSWLKDLQIKRKFKNRVWHYEHGWIIPEGKVKQNYSKESRVHGFVIPNGAVTGRMTHRSPNMAQVPSIHKEYGVECRSCWTVPEGYKLVGIDASGLELRILAHYMKDEEYTNEIINGDIHTTNQKLASLKSRDQAKTFIYAFLYGAGDAKIGKIIKANQSSGKKLKANFLSNLPSLRTLTERAKEAGARGYLKGLDGRKIYVRSPHASLNTLLQGGGAIVMKQALIFLDQYIKNEGLDAKFVANIHDEWQLEVKDTDADKVGQFGVTALQKAGEHFNMDCPLTGEYKIGGNWSETH